MAKFKKIILKPGTYQSPDGEIAITPARIQHWVTQFNKMRSEGLNIPTPWGHNSQAGPDQKEFFESKYNAGFLENLELDSSGYLTALVDVPREDDVSRIGTTVKEVSPQIESVWRDGKGKVWSDVITHLAFVTHPVVAGQTNFEKTDPLPSYAMRLSLANYKDKDKMATETIDMDKKPTERASSERASTTTKPSVRTSKKTETVSGGVDGELLDILASIGLILPEDVSDDNFIEALKASALTLKHKIDELDEEPGQGGEEDLELPPELLAQLEQGQGQQTPPAGTQSTDQGSKRLEEQPQTMTMSLSKELTGYKNRLSLAERKLEESDKKAMELDIKNLIVTGRITPVVANKLREEVRVYKLSLNQSGEPLSSPIQDKIDMFKMMPESTILTDEQKFRMRNVTEEIMPQDFKNVDDAEADRIADDQLKKAGRGGFVLN